MLLSGGSAVNSASHRDRHRIRSAYESAVFTNPPCVRIDLAFHSSFQNGIITNLTSRLYVPLACLA